MSSLTEGRERLTASARGTRSDPTRHHCESSRLCASIQGNVCDSRPTPEGAGGYRNMYYPRAEAVPSYRTLPGSLGERIMSLSGTLHRNPGLRRSEGKDTRCERCSATLVALKKQALSLSVHHHFSSKETSDLCAFLQDNLCVHSRSTIESRERSRELGECATCGTKLHQLKHEAVHLALSRGHQPSSARNASLLGQSNTKLGDRSASQPHSLNHCPQSPMVPRSPRTPQRTPQTLRRRVVKPPNQDMDRWVEEQHRVPPDGVNVYPHNQPSDNTGLRCTDIVHTSSKIHHLSRVMNIANTAAMSFLARAAEKLNLTRRKGQASDAAPAHLSNSFRDLIQKNPPPVPSCLLQAAIRTKDSPSIAKVKVVLRVNPAMNEGQPPVLHIDPSKKRAILLEPVRQSPSRAKKTSGRKGKDLLKAFHYDAVYPQDSSQTEVCAGVLADVIRCVLSGSDGCVLGLGSADVGSWSSMVGNAESIQKLGLIPCAISWLYSAIEKRREKTWTDLTVSVSAVELCCGEEDTLRDLLGEVVPSVGGIRDSPRAHIRLQDDPIHGIQLRNHNRVKAPTAERAASLLDVAIAARRHKDFTTFLSHSSIMFFTLHVQPPRTQENSTIGKASRGPTKLTMIDVCSGMRGGVAYTRYKPPHSDLGPVVLSLLSGHKTIPKKGSKLTMLLRESLSHANCHTTVITQVANSLAQLQETTSIIQLGSRIRRTQKRTKQSSSCSPHGSSLTRQKRDAPSLSLRAFHSTDEVDVDSQHFRLREELDEHSSSDQSCDTVIQIDSDGLIQGRAPPRLAKPEFVPIIPSLHPNKTDVEDPEFTALLQQLLKIPKLHGEKKDDAQGQNEMMKVEMKKPERDCLKCDTFAELQERLGCIDGEETMHLLKSSLKSTPIKEITQKPQSQKEPGKQATTQSSEVPQMLKQGLCCNQALGREKQTDGTFHEDNFQREDSGLYDCEECSATSSSEEPLNQTLHHNTTCRYQLPKNGAIHSAETLSSEFIHSETQGMSTNSPLQSALREENHQTADWFKADKRTSPVGKSLPASPPSPSCASSKPLSSSVLLGDIAANDPKKDAKEMKATITVTVQQPLDLKGQDELVFSMVEEVTISGTLDSGRAGGNIICIKDAAQSTSHMQSPAGTQPIQIISNITEDSATSERNVSHPGRVATDTEKLQYHSRKERILPSFINPMLINAEEWDSDDVKEKERTGMTIKCPESDSETHVIKLDKICNPNCSQISCDPVVLGNVSIHNDTAENKICGARIRNTERSHHGDSEDVYSMNHPKASLGYESAHRCIGNSRVIGVSLGCLGTSCASFNTGSLPRTWLNANCQETHNHLTDGCRDPRGLTSSTPCSPGVTLERRRGKQSSPVNHSLHNSSSLKYETDYKEEARRPLRRGVGSLFETSKVGMKHDHMSGRMMYPLEECGRLFHAKIDQFTSTSLGRNTCDLLIFDRESNKTSPSSKGNSKRSCDGSGKGAHKVKSVGDCTIPRASKSSRKTRQTNHSHNSNPSETLTQPRLTHSKLSAVGKLKMACPKVRRLSASSIKNLSLSRQGLQQSINRSASLSPDSKTVSFERTSSFLSSSPPPSFHSISRTPSQSSTCSSTKSAIQGFTNGRIPEFPKERPTSPTLSGLDPTGLFPSPYNQLTSPRTPSHMSGHASDTTSVLSGDLPPAMGKTSLYFSNRNSTLSSGYNSLVRDSEATASSTSNRDSVSDRSGFLLKEFHSSRSSRRRGNPGTHPRHLSDDKPFSTRQSSALQSRWADHGIPENFDIKVYEIDNVQQMQKKGIHVLQRQAAVLGSHTADDHRRQSPSQQMEQRPGVGRGEPHAGAHHTEPRLHSLTSLPHRRPLAEFRSGLPGAPGGP
ncbi:kinesin-like protein KIF26B isoform X2 [Syngnathoides biaculeatus]|uniref:kinesin-like protein KIF26B isoform X2 n=1 Tax=Syngnathoides biaculeatus TaxID=300417 RepID=UPI002ADDF6AC|nr:kinesin-like protein KIF26B isoform X2 [Syngnathoides biaculeatus]